MSYLSYNKDWFDMVDSECLKTFQDIAWPETELVCPYVRAEANSTDQ